MNSFNNIFLTQSSKYILLNVPRIKICLDKISEDEAWWSPNSSTNSIANLIIHISGNIQQYIISGLGGKPDTRKRDKEFSTKGGMDTLTLLSLIDSTANEAADIIRNLNANTLEESFSLQGYRMTGLEGIIHVTEHFSYHTGQIALITKMIANQSLGFYADRDLNIKNE